MVSARPSRAPCNWKVTFNKGLTDSSYKHLNTGIMDERSWTSRFFSGHPPEWAKTVEAEQGEFRAFSLDSRKWKLWKAVSRRAYGIPDQNQVSQVVTKSHGGRYVISYVAKMVSHLA